MIDKSVDACCGTFPQVYTYGGLLQVLILVFGILQAAAFLPLINTNNFIRDIPSPTANLYVPRRHLFFCNQLSASKETQDALVPVVSTTANRSKGPAKRRRGPRKTFESMIPRLEAFRKKHGHSNVTKQHEDSDLYQWVTTIRYNYVWQVRNWTETGRRTKLSPQKMQQLADLDFCWDTRRDRQRSWSTMIKRLEAYKAKYGHTVVDASHENELAEWTRDIRYQFRWQALNYTLPSHTSKHRRPKLSSKKLKALEDLGFDWNVEKTYLRWNEMFPRLIAFYREHGHTHVTLEDDEDLYRWTQTRFQESPYLQNPARSNNYIDSEEGNILLQQQLQDMWQLVPATWDQMYHELRQYWEFHGHCHVPVRENLRLSRFAQVQRREYRNYLFGVDTKLTPERIEKLQHFEWNGTIYVDPTWEDRYEQLKEFSERNGHADVPQDYPPNPALGRWCMNQRTKYRLNKEGGKTALTPERVEALERVDFKWRPSDRRWKEMFERLRAYQQQHGDIVIPKSDMENASLRQWRKVQRERYKAGKMSYERRSLLESIPGFVKDGRKDAEHDWEQLFEAMREHGIEPGGQVRQHWFDGAHRFDTEVKTEWTEEELVELWNQGDE